MKVKKKIHARKGCVCSGIDLKERKREKRREGSHYTLLNTSERV